VLFPDLTPLAAVCIDINTFCHRLRSRPGPRPEVGATNINARFHTRKAPAMRASLGAPGQDGGEGRRRYGEIVKNCRD
jgi:hypothetical protein